MRKIAVSISKGGTGKTTTAVNLSAGLARAGYKVLLIDTDTQSQAGSALGVDLQTGLAEVLSEDLPPDQAVSEVRERLWLLSGGSALAGAKRNITRQDYGAEHTLGRALSPLEGLYDYTIIDTAPGWDALTINVLFYAQEVLSPVSLEALTIRGLASFVKRLQDIQEYNKDLKLSYILPTFLDYRVRKSSEIMKQIETYFPEVLCKPIRYNVKVSEASGRGQSIFEYAPTSPGAEDYQALTDKVVNNGRSR